MFPTRLIIGQPTGVVFENIIRSRIAMQLYFLPSLILIRVAAVPLRHIARSPASVFVAIWIGSFAMARIAGVELGGDPISHAFLGFQFFAFGMLVHRLERSDSRRRVDLLLDLLALVAIVQADFDLPGPLDRFTHDMTKYGIIVATSLASERTTWDNSPLIGLGQRSMQIYSLHAPVSLKVVQILVAMVTPALLPRLLLLWTLTVALSVVMTVLLATSPPSRRIFGES